MAYVSKYREHDTRRYLGIGRARYAKYFAEGWNARRPDQNPYREKTNEWKAWETGQAVWHRVCCLGDDSIQQWERNLVDVGARPARNELVERGLVP